MFECLKKGTHRDYVFRKELETFTGGVLTEYSFESLLFKNMPDLPKPTKIGSRMAYKIDDIIFWLGKHAIIQEKR